MSSPPRSTTGRSGGPSRSAPSAVQPHVPKDELEALFADALAATESRPRKAGGRKPVDFEPSEAEKSLHIEVEDPADDLLDHLLDPGFDDLDRELRDALNVEDHREDGLDDEVEDLLTRSLTGDDSGFNGQPLSVSADLGDDEILAAGDFGTMSLSEARDQELAVLRAQNAELSRSLSTYELELRTSEERVQTLEAQVVGSQRQVANAAREVDAIRRRAERDREDLQKYAGEKSLKEFLGVYDNLERALAHAGKDRATALGQGVEMTVTQFGASLRRLGAERVDSTPGRSFDPAVHEAMGQDWHPEVPAGAVALEMQAGFTLHGRLLRAAVVMVSRGPKPESVGVGIVPMSPRARAGTAGSGAHEAAADKHGEADPLGFAVGGPESIEVEPVTEDMPRVPGFMADAEVSAHEGPRKGRP